MNKAFDNRLPSTYSLPSGYMSLLSNEYKNKMQVNEVINNKTRSPLCLLTLDKKYSIIITKFDLNRDERFKGFFVSNANVERSIGVTYSIIDNNLFKFQSNTDAVKPLSSLYITMAGDSIQKLIQNDSILSYHLLCKNLSIKYSEHTSIDIYLEPSKQANFNQVFLDILFYKRGNDLFFFLIAPNDNKLIDNELLNEIVGIN